MGSLHRGKDQKKEKLKKQKKLKTYTLNAIKRLENTDEEKYRGNQTNIRSRSADITEDYSVNSIFLISHKYVRNEPSAPAGMKQAALQKKMNKAANLARKTKQM